MLGLGATSVLQAARLVELEAKELRQEPRGLATRGRSGQPAAPPVHPLDRVHRWAQRPELAGWLSPRALEAPKGNSQGWPGVLAVLEAQEQAAAAPSRLQGWARVPEAALVWWEPPETKEQGPPLALE